MVSFLSFSIGSKAAHFVTKLRLFVIRALNLNI